MAKLVNITLTGIPKLDARLRLLEKRDARRIARNAVRAGIRVGAKQLRGDVPVGETKEVKKSVGSSLKKDRKSKLTEGKWGVNVGKKRAKQARHGAAVMVGTKDRRQKKTGRFTGAIKPTNNVVASAEKKSRSSVLATIVRKVKEGIAALR